MSTQWEAIEQLGAAAASATEAITDLGNALADSGITDAVASGAVCSECGELLEGLFDCSSCGASPTVGGS